MRFSVRRVEKPWGYELIFAHTERYVGKVPHIDAGHALSLQYYERKDETIFVADGSVEFQVEEAGELRTIVLNREDVKTMPRRMGASKRHSLPWIGGSLLLLLIGCQSSPKQPPATANQSVIESAKKAAKSPESEATPDSKGAAADPRNPETTVIVEKGADPSESPSNDLVRAARAERERRSQSPPAGVVITNQTLAQQRPPTGKKRAATPGPGAAKGQPTPASDASPGDSDESYWRNRGRDIRSRLRAEYENVDRLRRLTATMRERFYLTPQQLGRDEILWQEWGRLQESLSTAERVVDSTKKELTDFLEEGRVRGAHPGWLADGEEILLEYDRKKEEERQKATPPAQAIEPPVASDSGGGAER